MIEVLQGSPDDVVALVATGKGAGTDYRAVIEPGVENARNARERARFYYQLGAGFEGPGPTAAWEDFKAGVGHWRHRDRVAGLTGVDRIGRATMVFAFLMPDQAPRVYHRPGARSPAMDERSASLPGG